MGTKRKFHELTTLRGQSCASASLWVFPSLPACRLFQLNEPATFMKFYVWCPISQNPLFEFKRSAQHLTVFHLLAAFKIYWLPSNQRLYGSSPSHIYHQGLDTNPRLAINLLYGIFWSSVNAIRLKRYGWRCPCCISAALKMDASEIVRINVTPRVLVFSGSGYVLSLRAGARLLIGHLVATTLTIWQNLVHMCVCI